MDQRVLEAKGHFIQGVSRIAHFWGFPKAMGAIYGAIYLSPTPITLDELVTQVGVSKGAVSTSVRNLERLNMVHKHLKVGDRKDFYTAEEDFWKIIKSILKEREKSEFDLAIRSVSESLDILPDTLSGEDLELEQFYRCRMEKMGEFFNRLDGIVGTFLAFEDLRVEGIRRLFGEKSTPSSEEL
jgi:DNA-binding transcriptional regulator GbsR (MarR family)